MWSLGDLQTSAKGQHQPFLANALFFALSGLSRKQTLNPTAQLPKPCCFPTPCTSIPLSLPVCSLFQSSLAVKP